MKLVKFIDNRFQELRLAEQEADKRREFSLLRESETHALHTLRHIVGTIMKWVMVPVVLTRYTLVLMHVVERPEPVLINMLEEMKRKEEQTKKKIGMAEFARKKGKSDTINPNQPA